MFQSSTSGKVTAITHLQALKGGLEESITFPPQSSVPWSVGGEHLQRCVSAGMEAGEGFWKKSTELSFSCSILPAPEEAAHSPVHALPTPTETLLLGSLFTLLE